jgi:hypothetical protein
MTDIPADELLSVIKSHDYVNENIRFDERYGKPVMKVKEKGERLTVTCEMVGGPSKDNGFIIGTFFRGRIRERGGMTTLKGVITTAPIYHINLFALTVFFVYQCIRLGGFSPIPIIILGFSYILFKNEFRKQRIISAYLRRAVRRAEEKRHNKKTR